MACHTTFLFAIEREFWQVEDDAQQAAQGDLEIPLRWTLL